MEKKIVIAAAVAFSLVAGTVLLSGEALADKVITVTAADAVAIRVELTPAPGGNVIAAVCGRSKFSDGGVTPKTCYTKLLPPGTTKTAALDMLVKGTAFWKNEEGL